jgi:hypothetical protein
MVKAHSGLHQLWNGRAGVYFVRQTLHAFGFKAAAFEAGLFRAAGAAAFLSSFEY